MGKYEVTAGQYCVFLNAVARSDPYGLYSSSMNSFPDGCQITRHGSDGNYTYDFSGRPSGEEADWVNRPVNYVTWGHAARFANWLHNGQPTGEQDLTTTEDGSYYLNGAVTDEEYMAVTREPDATWVIPTEDEWYKAAYHCNDGVTGNYYDYPTSSDSAPGNDLIDPDPGNNATYVDGDFTVGGPYWRTEVGAHENSESPYGTLDQGGNVWEWNETVTTSHRGLRGGAYDSYLARLTAEHSRINNPISEHANLGFRVARVR
jgi:formylglycine-generating enzyme required for sulfatase activity